MGFYKSVKDMFDKRAESCKKKGDQHWAKAKSGEGGSNYTAARKQYEKAEENRKKAEKASSAPFKKK